MMLSASSAGSTSPESLKWDHSDHISLPSNESRECWAIRKMDWARLKRGMLKQNNPFPRLVIAYSVLFGFAGSFGVSIVPLYFSKDLPRWVLILYVVMTIAFLVLALILLVLDKKMNVHRASEFKEISTDMEEIEAGFFVQRENLTA